MNAFLLKDGGQENPYHLFFYMIGQLKAFDDGVSNVEFYYPPTDSILVEGAFSNLPPRFHRHTVIRNDCTYIESTVDSITRIKPEDESWVFKYIRSLYEHIWSQFKRINGKYTYISRKKASSRRMANESDYVDDLQKLGFSVVCMEDLSFLEQIQLFAESQIITGPHGAAFTFAVFSYKDTMLYEIYPPEHMKGHYISLAYECGLQYNRFYTISSFDHVSHDMTLRKETYLEDLQFIIYTMEFLI